MSTYLDRVEVGVLDDVLLDLESLGEMRRLIDGAERRRLVRVDALAELVPAINQSINQSMSGGHTIGTACRRLTPKHQNFCSHPTLQTRLSYLMLHTSQNTCITKSVLNDLRNAKSHKSTVHPRTRAHHECLLYWRQQFKTKMWCMKRSNVVDDAVNKLLS